MQMSQMEKESRFYDADQLSESDKEDLGLGAPIEDKEQDRKLAKAEKEWNKEERMVDLENLAEDNRLDR
jgi:hypothetical protein